MLSDHFSDDNIDAALNYLAETDEQYGKFKVEVDRTKFEAKRQESIEIIAADGSAQLRSASATLSPAVAKAWAIHFDAIERFESLKVKRERLDSLIDAWRSFISGKKQGVL